ncbi:efflux RND transporter periplasmic adaptor subunit [Pseudoalteromonas denitrificans]|uniref:HlyD family secretion protein n=1 Tax=Pseudoalteromonas denitrificans DSM 6059 TaxID=1123010 RepID=A0A1I1NAS7_9GAMM|nr:HlyD family efflux transporter periplasmic adaptor subunit [Pseudoalteromonas denitrificans]SFC92578.1 HlyD family secretion protein [Pseudoalteromonas denitrificans DSM 6059]
MSAIQGTGAQDSIIETNSSLKTRIVYFILVLLIIIITSLSLPAFSKWMLSEHTVSQTRIQTAKVKFGSFTRDFSVQARVVAGVKPKLYSPSQGVVTFMVSPGDKVNKSQVIAKIHSPELENLYEQAQTRLSKYKTQLARQKIQAKRSVLEAEKLADQALVKLNAAKREMKRSDEAESKSLISDIDFQKAKDDLQNAQLEYKHAIKESALALESLEFEVQSSDHEVINQALKVKNLKRQVKALNITSPVTGMIGTRFIEQKSAVNKHQAIMNVIELENFELVASIPESYADDLALGMKTEIIHNGKNITGELVGIAPEVINNKVEGRIRFSDKLPMGLRQNQRLTTRILFEEINDVFYLPRGAFIDGNGGREAYLIKDEVAYKTKIKIGAKSLSKVEIISGLKSGDEVVVSQLAPFNNAQQVAITQ